MANCLIIRKITLPDGTAVPSQVLSGITFQSSNSDDTQTGTMTNRGAISASVSAGSSYTIPSGYHNGSGKVTNPCGYIFKTVTSSSDTIELVQGARYAFCTWAGYNRNYTSVCNATFYGITINSMTYKSYATWEKGDLDIWIDAQYGELTATTKYLSMSWDEYVPTRGIILFRLS